MLARPPIAGPGQHTAGETLWVCPDFYCPYNAYFTDSVCQAGIESNGKIRP